jgi:hypothetical protein
MNAREHHAPVMRLIPACAVCRGSGARGRRMERATFVGAPDGGLPVHLRCLTDFFKIMEVTNDHEKAA